MNHHRPDLGLLAMICHGTLAHLASQVANTHWSNNSDVVVFCHSANCVAAWSIYQVCGEHCPVVIALQEIKLLGNTWRNLCKLMPFHTQCGSAYKSHMLLASLLQAGRHLDSGESQIGSLLEAICSAQHTLQSLCNARQFSAFGGRSVFFRLFLVSFSCSSLIQDFAVLMLQRWLCQALFQTLLAQSCSWTQLRICVYIIYYCKYNQRIKHICT